MVNRTLFPETDQTSQSIRNLEHESSTKESIFVEKRSHCLIYPANRTVIAESIQRRNKSWFVQTKDASDLLIKIGEYSFHLHKIPMHSRSEYLSRVASKSSCIRNFSVRIDNIPGGAKIFELVVKFCYGWKISITARNVAPLYCAAHFLEMTDELEQGNLISKAEAFLSFVIVSSWKDTFRIFKSCESISSWSRDLQILKRCSESIAWKICTNDNASSLGSNEVFLNAMADSMDGFDIKKLPTNWWFEDVSHLRIDNFIEVINSIKKKKVEADIIGLCIAHWTKRWLSKITVSRDTLDENNLTIQLHRVTTECLIRMLPVEENSVSCSFLLHLYKIGLIMKVDVGLLGNLKTRVALMLENCKANELLVKNSITLYDVEIVVEVIKAYVSHASDIPQSRLCAVGRLIDEYLVLVAKDKNLPAQSYQLLVEALPREARPCDDSLYRAIDIYLKAHPDLTEEERSNICRVLAYERLSQEARTHAMKNDRLSDKIRTKLLLVDQVSMMSSLAAAQSRYQRTKAEAILRVSKRVGKVQIISQKEIELMKADIQKLKDQISRLQECKMDIWRQMHKVIT